MSKRLEHRAEQAARVAAYTAWLQSGMPAGEMPAAPTDADYTAARKAAAEGDPVAGPRRDDCPDCGGGRTELTCAVGRFYCTRCGAAGPGPAAIRVGSQLTLDQVAA